MTHSPFDGYRPPEPPRRGRRRRDRREGAPSSRRDLGRIGSGDGGREMPMVQDVEFSSYYGRPVVKAPPWGTPIGIYLFVGGLAGGSALLAAGAQLTGRALLRRNARLTALAAIAIGTPALIEDLGRPERFLHMLRVLKPTSPMSLGTWILSAFATGAGATAVLEIDRMTGERIPLGPLRPLLQVSEGPAAAATTLLGAPLAAYTAVLLGDTAVPTWHAARKGLPYVFVSSATMAACGLALVTTPVRETGPVRALAAAAVMGEIAGMHHAKASMHPLEAEPLETGRPGRLLHWAERLAVGGGIGAVLGGRSRVLAAASGAALAAASALTRFGVLEAGIESVKDPRRVMIPQRERLEKRRAEGVTDDGITTGPSVGGRGGDTAG